MSYAFLLALCFTIVTEAICGPIDFNSTNDYNETSENGKDYHPWQLSVRIDGDHECGATLVSNRTALTSRQCLDVDDPTSNITVVCGLDQLEPLSKIEKTRKLNVKRISEYSKNSDMILLIFRKVLNFSEYEYAHVEPIDLADVGETFQSDQCFSSGWGSAYGQTSTDAEDVNVKLSNKTSCESQNLSVGVNETCGLSETNGCNIDNGGPLICTRDDGTPVLYAVEVEGGEFCEEENSAVVYSLSAYYRYWMIPSE